MIAMTNLLKLIFGLSVACILASCFGNGSNEPSPYAAEQLWLCKPGASSNRCLELDQTRTDIHSDTSWEVVEHTPATNPAFDCFYVYPTVDNNAVPGNTLDLSDDEAILRPLNNQAARFTELCDVYAPLYRQMTLSTYGVEGGYRQSEFFDIAYNDVSEAFSQYIRESNGRPFVLMGHSQGSHMLIELLIRRFEKNPALRDRLISALLLGPTGVLQVPPGQISGGTFNNIPLCTTATDTGCIIAYDSIAAGRGLIAQAQARPCVNPTLLGGTPGMLENTIWEATSGMIFPEAVDTPSFAYPRLHTANCESDGFLAIDTLDEERTATISPQVVQIVVGSSTLHLADVNYAMGDLLRIVATQADNM